MKEIQKEKIIPWEEVQKELLEELKTDPKKLKEYWDAFNEEKEDNDRLIRARLARQIKKARKLAGLSQEQLAKTMKTTKSYISEIENAKQNISIEYVVRVATALHRKVEIKIS